MAAELLRRFPDVRITATDFDPAMVELAGETLRPFGERATTRRADATSLPFDAETAPVELRRHEHVRRAVGVRLEHVGHDAQRDAGGVVGGIEGARHGGIEGGALALLARAGGLLAVYDLVESAVTRALHRLGPSHGERLVGLDELEPLLARLPLTQIDVTPSIGLLVRFSARKR